ncbi:sphingosine kinase 2-like isoform X1 [Cotesia glomerata]|uniref:sphingosine kinase 2-like isoform X1 n=1 Tax=Cotesia glomerata TaxID=32391 RepID=UPI001D014B5A|nr:sphingosine kinase 2-like isoform X1 [Cotesia glomerata]XP_044586475.1 sphingosine kinase 2-like isoform X1 [Cotesia glomerata]XP_044586476.1 sphingosine kinase 2-like isoform X1 [Cotesia glomerata]XP_044586477.1 sphingosine kinase 2-like isoform X1 [Cotesia glomerata]
MDQESSQLRSSTLLEETFYITSKKNTYYRVKLTEKGLSLEKESNGGTKTETIALSDIIGCRCMRSKRRNTGSCACRPTISKPQMRDVEFNDTYHGWDQLDTSAYLYIYAYTLKKARVKGAPRRERTTITLRFRSFDKYQDNLREASRWRLAIKCLINKIPIPKNLMSPSHGNLDTLLKACSSEEKKLLVLLNPKSGPGRSREIFQRRVHPILSEAEKLYEVHVTKCQNYARDFIRTRNIYQWSGILCVGGDGVVFEVINGLLERPDWKRALEELPLGIIPCGSGNGLAKSIAYAKQEPYDSNPFLISALSVVKNKYSPIDLVRIETRSQILYSFLSVGWGLIADIDIESERLRAIGGQRFTIWSIARLIGLRVYKGTVSYLPCDNKVQIPSINENKSNGTYLYETKSYNDNNGTGIIKSNHDIITHSKSYGDDLDRSYCDGVKESKSYHDVLDSVTSDLGDIYLDDDNNEIVGENLSLETEVQTRTRLDSFYSATSRKSTYYSTGSASSYHSMEDSSSLTPDGEENTVNNRCVYGPSSSLPALTAQLPSGWTQIKGEFVAVHASYQSHIGEDGFIAPRAKLDDGIIWLLIIKAGITRANLLQFLLGLNAGTHLTSTGVDMIPVKAFRIEPETSTTGNMTVDGEKVDYGPLQAEVFSSMATVMSP